MFFLTKSKIDYNENFLISENDKKLVDDFLYNFFEDKNIGWQIISASLRYNVDWKKIILLYDSRDVNNRVFQKILENLISPYYCYSIKTFSNRKRLKYIVGSNCVISRRLGKSCKLNRIDNLKSLIKKEPFPVAYKEGKYDLYVFRGLVIESVEVMGKICNDEKFVKEYFLPLKINKEDYYYMNEILDKKNILEYILYKSLIDKSFFENPYKIHTSKNILNSFIS